MLSFPTSIPSWTPIIWVSPCSFSAMFDFKQILISLHFSPTSASSVWSTTISVQISSKTSCFDVETHDQVIYGQIYNSLVSNKTKSNLQSLFEPTSILSISLVSESTSMSSRSRAEICLKLWAGEEAVRSIRALLTYALTHNSAAVMQQMSWSKQTSD